MRTVTIYRDDSTVQVVYERVKHVFWTAGNSMLVIAQYTNEKTGAHRYIHWPRERFCWFKDEPTPKNNDCVSKRKPISSPPRIRARRTP